MIKRYLMTPGPTPIPEDIMLNMAMPIIHHRTQEFKNIFSDTKELAKKVFQTKNNIAIFTSSGTGAMEASVSNLLSPNDKAIAISAGKFGERWGQIIKSFDARLLEIEYEYGDYAKISDIDKLLSENPDTKALFMQASETSTGVFHPIDEIGKLIREKYPEVVFVVDGITAIGAIDVKTDDWGIDIMITGSQKALMLPPGLSIMSVSKKAKKMMEASKNRYYYFDILKELKSDGGAYTPAVTLIEGLNLALRKILDEGLDNLFKRHALLAKATQEAAKALGLKLFAKRPANSLTAIETGVDSSEVIKIMKEFGVHVSNGQGHLKGKIVRIAHLGYFDKPDIIMAISGLEIALKKLNIDAPFGAGVKKAMEIFVEE
jgi:aspartate aminotransferase-like enzyme